MPKDFRKSPKISRIKNPILKRTQYHSIRYQPHLVPGELDAIIIGSGMGLLTTAALLSLSGKRVLVLEQHDVAGGTLHTFEDHGVEFETGLHYVGNIPKNKAVYDLLTQNKLEWCQMGRETNKNIYDEVVIGKEKYQLPAGVDNLIQYLINIFPYEEHGIRKYFELVKGWKKRFIF